jgi:thioredoxin-related protein
MKSFRIDRIVVALMALLIIFDGLMYWHIREKQDHLFQNSDDVLRAPWQSEENTTPVGFTSDLERVAPVVGAGPGMVVRFTSKNCKYCQQDMPMWEKMSAMLQKKGYQTIVLVPSARDEYRRDALVPAEAKQMTYVNIEWIAHLRLHATPMLLVFDSKGNLRWSHEGVLGLSDLDSAEHAVERKKQ